MGSGERFLQSARKMTPGTFGGQSRVATPAEVGTLLSPNPTPVAAPLLGSFHTDIYGSTVSGSVSMSARMRALASSDGSVFVFEALVAGTDIMAATDPTVSPFVTVASLSGEPQDVVQVGDVAHITTITGTSGDILYYQYDMATDTLSSPETIASGVGVTLDGSAKLSVRSNGEVVAWYGAPIGGGDSRLSYRIRSAGGTWGTAVVVHSAPAGTIMVTKALVPGTSGRLHMVWGNGSSVVVQRTLTSANSVEAETALFTSDFYTNRVSFPYDHTPTSNVYLGFISSTSRASVATFGSADVPSAATEEEVTTLSSVTGLTYDGVTMCALYADSPTTRNIYAETGTGSGWAGTVTTLQTPYATAVTAAVYGVNRYTRVGREVVAYITQFQLASGGFRYFYSEQVLPI